jgi:hypothetical protein
MLAGLAALLVRRRPRRRFSSDGCHGQLVARTSVFEVRGSVPMRCHRLRDRWSALHRQPQLLVLARAGRFVAAARAPHNLFRAPYNPFRAPYNSFRAPHTSFRAKRGICFCVRRESLKRILRPSADGLRMTARVATVRIRVLVRGPTLKRQLVARTSALEVCSPAPVAAASRRHVADIMKRCPRHLPNGNHGQ